ncbi:MAG TPA: YbhB/YbcL family Raf kinase inhibitor-like protein [Thermoanaerobaculia bacterium]|nr:YbhB/YbcL family Raf kinase inhibitor-like protein [Thermoanaerobaculia bacterium]HUM30215.1 YbhB/YbcL family Raf kinase inhibitor-like protein [Thermoanaerobaculia bacterium]HXK68336.1 YbhB/YbcL family Raf kinase inhibitor-like protein [Thermoanaerobaculia bacterium]
MGGSISLIFFILVLPAALSVATPENERPFVLRSTAFREGEMIPVLYTCDGKDLAPPLSWEGAPEGTRSFTLIMDDPDAPVGTWDHWVIFNIPHHIRAIDAATKEGKEIMASVTWGKNSWGRQDYGGPCPPGGTHRYVFRLYALDILLNLKPGADKKEVEAAMKENIIGETRLVGRYRRSK